MTQNLFLTSLTQEERALFEGKYDLVENYPLEHKNFEIDNVIVNHIKSTFAKIKGSTTEDHDVSGQTLDIEKYIQYRLNKKFSPRENHDREFFNITEDKQGLTVGILIDISASMYKTIDNVRNIIASIYKGLSYVPNIKIIVYLYTGDLNNRSYKMNLIINEIKSLEECTGINTDKITLHKSRYRSRYSGYKTYVSGVSADAGYTPTFLAIDYMTNKLRKIQQSEDRKTHLILVTDGMPASYTLNKYQQMDELLAQKLTYRAVTKAQANNIQTFCIAMGLSEVANKELSEMFKQQIAYCKDISGVQKELIKKVDEFIKEANR